MKDMAKIIYNKEECIGCGSCAAVCPDFWEMGDDMKLQLKNSVKNAEGKFELEIEKKDLACNEEAAQICPVQVIKIEK